MKRIVYSSAATGFLDEKTLADILGVARVRNARRDISGMLLYRDGVFLQLLEGSAIELGVVFNSIRVDPRHQRVTVLVEETIPSRAFPAWSMGYGVPQDSDLTRPGTAPKTLSEIAHDAPLALQLLLRFAGPAAIEPPSTALKLRRAALLKTGGRS